MLAGIGAAIGGLIIPFSATKQAAEYIQKNFGDSITVAGVRDYCVSPITQYLHRPIYFPNMQTFAFYNTQNDRERCLVSGNDLIDQLAALASEGDVIFIRQLRATESRNAKHQAARCTSRCFRHLMTALSRMNRNRFL